MLELIRRFFAAWWRSGTTPPTAEEQWEMQIW